MDQTGDDGDVTLAFELSALQQLAEPGTAFADARQWTTYVGVVSDLPTYVITNFTRKRRIREDFFSGPEDKAAFLESATERFVADRYVFVGTSEEDERVAESAGWEYVPIEEAAASADWELGDPRRLDGDPEREDWP
jgi:hypothetical protein